MASVRCTILVQGRCLQEGKARNTSLGGYRRKGLEVASADGGREGSVREGKGGGGQGGGGKDSCDEEYCRTEGRTLGITWSLGRKEKHSRLVIKREPRKSVVAVLQRIMEE